MENMGPPTVGDGFILRMCKAMRMSPRDLARHLDMPYKKEFEPLLKLGDAQLVDIDRHDMWRTMKDMVDEQMGLLMAVQHSLNRALQKDRIERAKRLERTRAYHEQR